MNDNIYVLTLIGTLGPLLLAATIIYLVIKYQRKLLAQKLAAQKAELQHSESLLHATIQSQENERIRISRDLHDHVGSTLSSLRQMFNQMNKVAPDQPQIKTLSETYKESIDNIMNDVRDISHSLSPPGLALWGLQFTLEDFCDKISRSSDLQIRVVDDGDSILKQMTFESSLSLFRVMQELLANTIKHAHAKNVTISINKKGEDIAIQYKDDGRGSEITSKTAGGMGMHNIESRLNMISAQYEIITAPGKGFIVNITLPQSSLSKTTLYE